MKSKEEDERNQVYRETLRPNWQKLDYDKTDRGRKMPKPLVCKQYLDGEIFDLETDIRNLSVKTLYEVVHSRRSLRKYNSGSMTKQELAYIANLTCETINFGPGYAFGVIPSGGATSSLETYFYLHDVEGFDQGIYHYMKRENKLMKLPIKVTSDLVNKAMSNQLRNAQIVVFWTATPYRTEYKYSFTAHKMIAMEAGHACQNLYLASESLDYGAVAIAAYNQELSDQLLEIGGEEFVIYIATVGRK
ncbi:MAG: SagB/ThcOx family dehydrogenase [Bacilli bacterium]|nr:SagB/ThcOx family dehydrogenase [Bacilli bacterium]MBN2877246.1 SagB/ThcOx family dehydrogenase [Bacilli bacterium]